MENENRRRELPVVRADGVGYYLDLCGRQFRETMNPAARVDFDSVKGAELCRKTSVVTCLACGMSALTGRRDNGEDLRCMRCGRKV